LAAWQGDIVFKIIGPRTCMPETAITPPYNWSTVTSW
jgi:hypothetical protein